MADGYPRMIGAQINGMRRSLGALIGIAQGMLCDGNLSDEEIRHLKKWLDDSPQLQYAFPGDVVYDKISEVLKDGKVTEEERAHLVTQLQALTGQTDTDLSGAAQVTEMVPYSLEKVDFLKQRFCFTGEFVHGSRTMCESEIIKREGFISNSVTMKLNYLVIGSLGSVEWKNGSFGNKIDVAMKYKTQKGLPIFIVREKL